MKKIAAFKKHQKVLKRHKMSHLFWVVVQDLDKIMICKNRFTGEFRCIKK
jgi:hypothetical protein